MLLQVSIAEPYDLSSMVATMPGDSSTMDRVKKVVGTSERRECFTLNIQ